MTNENYVDEVKSWDLLLEQASDLVHKVQNQDPTKVSVDTHLEEIHAAESKYWEAISSMRIWDDCFQFQWIDSVIDLADFYFWQGKHVEAINLLTQVTAIYKKMKWHFENMDGWSMLVEMWLILGKYETAQDLIETISQRKESFIQEEIARAQMADSTDLSVLESDLRRKMEHDKLAPLVEGAQRLKERTENTSQAMVRALEPLNRAIDKLQAENPGELIDSFEVLKEARGPLPLLDKEEHERLIEALLPYLSYRP